MLPSLRRGYAHPPYLQEGDGDRVEPERHQMGEEDQAREYRPDGDPDDGRSPVEQEPRAHPAQEEAQAQHVVDEAPQHHLVVEKDRGKQGPDSEPPGRDEIQDVAAADDRGGDDSERDPSRRLDAHDPIQPDRDHVGERVRDEIAREREIAVEDREVVEPRQDIGAGKMVWVIEDGRRFGQPERNQGKDDAGDAGQVEKDRTRFCMPPVPGRNCCGGAARRQIRKRPIVNGARHGRGCMKPPGGAGASSSNPRNASNGWNTGRFYRARRARRPALVPHGSRLPSVVPFRP